jgi:hypothetical protein
VKQLSHCQLLRTSTAYECLLFHVLSLAASFFNIHVHALRHSTRIPSFSLAHNEIKRI